jgi:diaminopimelate epimerase
VDSGARPGGSAAFYKAHGLGNDYLVFEEGEDWRLDARSVRAVCERWRGPGGDGIVVRLRPGEGGPVRLRMFNPDGSEFERSGNGLRVLASYLARRGEVGGAPFRVEVGGDEVTMTVHGRTGDAWDVSVAMGRARIGPEAVGLDRTALDADGRLPGPDGAPLDLVPVSVGNPHLVVLHDAPNDAELRRLGPFLASHPALVNGANVQLARQIGPSACRALIWERGVGRTAASGTSSCAVAVASIDRGLVAPGAVTVVMDGGELLVEVTKALDVTLRGPVSEVFEGILTPGFLEALGRPGAGG